MNQLRQVKVAASLLSIGVITGAFGAHSLKAVLTADQLSSWKTAVLYLFIHALGMLVVSGMSVGDKKIRLQSFYLFLIGIFCFSGSIFLLTLQDTLGLDLSWLGPITPIGGLQFILGWLNLLRLTSQPDDH